MTPELANLIEIAKIREFDATSSLLLPNLDVV